MDEFKVILYDDRNQSDIRIRSAIKNMEIFCKKTFSNYEFCPNEVYHKGDLGIIWGIPSKYKKNTQHRKKIHDLQRQYSLPLIVVEVGFLKRDIYYSIGYNSIVGFGYYGSLKNNHPSDRFDQLGITVKPYDKNHNSNGYILLCGQVHHDTQLQHIDYPQWLNWVVSEIKKYSNREIIYRPHPKFKGSGKFKLNNVTYSDSQKKTLIEDMKGAYVVISFNSNSLVESLIEGIPFYSFDQGSVVHDIANHDLRKIEEVSFPSDEIRMQKLYNIAYYQWNLEEIRNGLFWEYLREIMNESTDENIDFHYHKLKSILV